MKKILFSIMSVMLLVLTSCGADYAALNEKIEKDGPEAEFSKSEYADMLNYVEDAFENSKDVTLNDFDKFEKEYPYFMSFSFALGIADSNKKLDEKTSKKLQELLKKFKQTDEMGSSATEIDLESEY